MTTLTATVVAGSGKPGTGRVTFTAPAGALSTASETLDARGQATATFTCAVQSDPACHRTVRIDAVWEQGAERAEDSAGVAVGMPLPVDVKDGGGTLANDAGLAADCSGVVGAELVLATTGRPEDIVTDGVSVFWTDSMLGTVNKRALAGGAPVVLASGLTTPMSIGLDASSVYWSSYPAKGLFRVSKAGGAATSIYPETAFRLHLASGFVFFTTSNSRTVLKVPTSGGAFTKVADEPDLPSAVIASSNATYWVTDTSGHVMKSVGAGAPVQLATGLGRATTLALTTDRVVWGTTSGTIGSVSTAGGSPATLFSGLGFVGFLITSQESLYWSEYGRSTVSKGDVSGGTPVVLASGQSSPGGLTVAGSCLYWVNRGSGELMRAKR